MGFLPWLPREMGCRAQVANPGGNAEVIPGANPVRHRPDVAKTTLSVV
ncbi:hypothetical protein LNKW23_06420 [Paralimibaculum aggregatum]|uniref:Uncharacterized protein n=1 Tax=Paralimibaculum aggregatum TaxID=3036245 RepID=A0ABQ6LH48_9RHOB|nr:hypothetical protein LNKW23_06420 [Limibaculum sp. NKW23]